MQSGFLLGRAGKVLSVGVSVSREGERDRGREKAFIEGMGGLLKRGWHCLEASGRNSVLYLEFDGAELRGQAE